MPDRSSGASLLDGTPSTSTWADAPGPFGPTRVAAASSAPRCRSHSARRRRPAPRPRHWSGSSWSTTPGPALLARPTSPATEMARCSRTGVVARDRSVRVAAIGRRGPRHASPDRPRRTAPRPASSPATSRWARSSTSRPILEAGDQVDLLAPAGRAGDPGVARRRGRRGPDRTGRGQERVRPARRRPIRDGRNGQLAARGGTRRRRRPPATSTTTARSRPGGATQPTRRTASATSTPWPTHPCPSCFARTLDAGHQRGPVPGRGVPAAPGAGASRPGTAGLGPPGRATGTRSSNACRPPACRGCSRGSGASSTGTPPSRSTTFLR